LSITDIAVEQTTKIEHAQRNPSAGRWPVALIPFVFVLCWASGFVVPRAFEHYSEPLTLVACATPAPLRCSLQSPSASMAAKTA
jgi:hypothetical protein